MRHPSLPHCIPRNTPKRPAVGDPVTGEASEPLLATNRRTGGAYPAVDPQGAWVYFAEYNAEGWDVARVPFASGEGPVAALAADRFDVREAFPVRGSVDGEVKKYSPEATLMPAYWRSQVAPITWSWFGGWVFWVRYSWAALLGGGC